jgi:hypothetical protein
MCKSTYNTIFINKDTLLFTFTIISHAKSVQLLYMLGHSSKYDHAYFTFHIETRIYIENENGKKMNINTCKRHEC